MVAGQSLVKFLNNISIKEKSWGWGDVEGVKWECASTSTASGASGEANTGPHLSGEREGDRDQRGGGASPELMPARGILGLG